MIISLLVLTNLSFSIIFSNSSTDELQSIPYRSFMRFSPIKKLNPLRLCVNNELHTLASFRMRIPSVAWYSPRVSGVARVFSFENVLNLTWAFATWYSPRVSKVGRPYDLARSNTHPEKPHALVLIFPMSFFKYLYPARIICCFFRIKLRHHAQEYPSAVSTQPIDFPQAIFTHHIFQI